MPQDNYFAALTAHPDERARLAALEAANDPKSRRHLLELGTGPGCRCLEVGAGGGSIARWMAERVGADGQVVAGDADTRFLADIHDANIEVRVFDILADKVESGFFDIVHCRFVLMHLDDPQLAVRRMVDAAKPGAWILVEEPDFSSYRASDPDDPRSQSFTAKVQGMFAEAGRSGLFDPYLGLSVRSLLEAAGLTDVGSDGTAYLWRGGEAEAEEHRLSLPALTRAGVCPPEDAAEVARALADPAFSFVGHTMFAAWGRRPAEQRI